jgi:hypothetical protein
MALNPAVIIYASIAATPPLAPGPKTVSRKKVTFRKPLPQAHPDTRLFLRIGPDNITRKIGLFTVLIALWNALSTEAKLL